MLIGKPVVKFSPNLRSLTERHRKEQQNFFVFSKHPRKSFFLSVFLWRLRKPFDKAAEFFWQTSENILHTVRKVLKKYILSQTNHWFRIFFRTRIFTPKLKFRKKTRKPKNYTEPFLSKCFWTCRMQFGNPTSKMFRTLKIQFWRPCPTLCANILKLFSWKAERLYNSVLLSTIEFPQNGSSGHVGCILTTLPETFCQNLKIFFGVQKTEKRRFFKRNVFFPIVPLDTLDAVLTTLLKTFRQKSGFSFRSNSGKK